MERLWNRADILRVVQSYTNAIKPDRIVTFDPDGVDHDPLRVAIARSLSFGATTSDYYAMNHTHRIVSRDTLNEPQLFWLRTAPVAVKYLGVYGAVIYAFAHQFGVFRGYMAVTPLLAVCSAKLQQAFVAYETRLTWDRMLWMTVSRFLYFNHLEPVN